jgi:hypothetical protein
MKSSVQENFIRSLFFLTILQLYFDRISKRSQVSWMTGNVLSGLLEDDCIVRSLRVPDVWLGLLED